MAEGDGVIYNEFKEELLKGTIDCENDTFKLILVAGHTPNIDTHTGYSSVSGDEESGTGYTAGGETLASLTVTKDNTNDRASWDAADVTWTGLDVGTPSHAILYDDTVTSPADCLVAYWEVTTASNGGNYTIQWGANGIILLT